MTEQQQSLLRIFIFTIAEMRLKEGSKAFENTEFSIWAILIPDLQFERDNAVNILYKYVSSIRFRQCSLFTIIKTG